MTNILRQAQKYILYLTVFLMPFSFLTVFPNPFETPKIVLLFSGVAIAAFLWAIAVLASNEPLEITFGSFDLGVLLVAAAYLLSALLRTPNKMEAFFLPGASTLFMGGALLYFLINQLEAGEKKVLSLSVFFSAVAMAALYLLSFSGVLSKIPNLPPFLKDPFFTPIGGLFSLALFLAILIPLSASLVVAQSKIVYKLFVSVASLIIFLAAGIAVFNLLPGKSTSPTLPPWPASWAVAIETIKESPILGVGPGNYLSAFSRFLPLSFNGSSLWAVRFTTGSDFFLTSISEAGILALAAFVFIFVSVLRRLEAAAKNANEMGPLAALLLTFTLLIFFPGTTAQVVLLFTFLSLASTSRKVNLPTSAGRVISVLLVVVLGALIFNAVKVAAAEVTFGQSLSAISANDAPKTYNLMAAAINKNPGVDRYHAIYAQINLALARNLAQAAAPAGKEGQPKTLSDQDKQNISQLVSQAIAEGKAAVTLNPQRSGNWELLARIYQAIMPLASGADQFTIQAMNQAVALDPINPNLRIELGGVYYALGRYDEAIDSFKLATFAKGDLANGHYNLSAAYRQKKEIQRAIDEMNIVISQVKKDSDDYKLAKSELENLQKSLPATQTGSENLTPPQKAAPQVIKPPLELPKEATPPASR